MENGGATEDVAQLKAENERRLRTIKQLTIEKNMMEYRLHRAYHKLLQTKKRKLKRVERQLRKLRGEIGADDEDSPPHCESCTCGKSGRSQRRPVAVEERGGGGESDDTMDPGSCYGSDTDIDDEPPCHSNAAYAPETSIPSTGTSSTSAAGNPKEGCSKVLYKKDHKVPDDKTETATTSRKPARVPATTVVSENQDQGKVS